LLVFAGNIHDSATNIRRVVRGQLALGNRMKPESTLLPADWGVPPVFRQRLGESAGRQRIMEANGHLLIVLHAPPGADEAGRRGRFFWRDPQGTWKAAPRAEQVSSLGDHLITYRATIETLEQAEEDAQTASEYFQLLDHLAPLARAARNLHDVVQQARDAIPVDRRLIVARDEAYEISRRADLLYDDAKNGMEFAMARQTEALAESSHQMSASSHRLNVLVAFFFPIATLMTILSANLTHGLEKLDQQHGPWVLGACIVGGLVLGMVITAIIAQPVHRPPRKSSANRKRK
jgi:hypothetical protein